MHEEVLIEETEVDIEIEEEKPEKTVCATLVFTNEQMVCLINTISNRSYVQTDYNNNIEMDNTTVDLSVTATFSEKDIEELKTLVEPKSLEARLILTDEQKNDLQKAFNLLDYNGEGKIKAEDFRVAIKALGYEPTKEELQKMISGVDKGQTGKLSFENFETAIMRKVMSQDSDGGIMKSFRLFDMNDTGFISAENIKRVTEILGEYLTDEEIEEMVDDADKDYDGYISVQEFMRMIKNSVKIVTP